MSPPPRRRRLPLADDELTDATVDELAAVYVDTLAGAGESSRWAALSDQQHDAHRLAVGALVQRLIVPD